MLGPNFRREEILRPVKIVPTLKIIDADNFRHILMPFFTLPSPTLTFFSITTNGAPHFSVFSTFHKLSTGTHIFGVPSVMVRQTFSLVPTCQHSKDHMWIWLKWPHYIPSTIYTLIETHHYSALFAPPRLPPASRDCHFGPLIYF